MLIGIFHKWNNGQYLVMSLITYNTNPRDYFRLDIKTLDRKIIGKYMIS